MDRRRFALALLAVLGLALAMRTLPLYWSPHVATLDGFSYVRDAEVTIETGSIPLDGFRSEDFVFTTFTAVTSSVLGVRPLFALQPLMAPVGTTAVLAGIALVYRCCGEMTSQRRARSAALLAGLLLAVSGIYLRRTLVPDSDILAHAFVPLLAIAWYRLLWTGRRAWAAVAAAFLIAFPLVHTLSVLIAALTLTGVTVAAIVARQPVRRVVSGVIAVVGFWAYVGGYYAFAEAHPQVTVSYIDRVTSPLGLSLAWVFVFILGIWWFLTTSSRLRKLVVGMPFVIAALALGANEVTTVFPGTIPTPPGLLPLMALNLVAVTVAVRAWGVVPPRGMAMVVVALLAAPVVVMYFSLTASLTPEYFATALRAHTFVYLPLLALAAIGAVSLRTGDSAARRWVPGGVGAVSRRQLRSALVVVLVVSMAGTAPLAYVALDTMRHPGSTTPAEFAATEFAGERVTGGVATDHALSRVVLHFQPGTADIAPTRRWLTGAPPPERPALSRESWTTTGAHFFPGAPLTISQDRYDRAMRCRHEVYATTTRDSLSVTLPASAGC